jgi:hypothetical protein
LMTTAGNDSGGAQLHGAASQFHPGLFERCANPGCHSGWLHLFRNRAVPVFEEGWSCSPECTIARLDNAVRREFDGRGSGSDGHRHRLPLGLLMLEHGWITPAQLRCGLDAQKASGEGRLGDWLVGQHSVGEELVARALAIQWNCAVFPLGLHDSSSLAAVMPRLFVDAFGALPLRIATSRFLYLGFEESLDPPLALAIERMTGLHVESGILQSSSFRPAQARMLDARYPSVELVEAATESAAARALARSVERSRPVASRLVRAHDCLWLRMWLSVQTSLLPEIDSVKDVVCSIGAL